MDGASKYVRGDAVAGREQAGLSFGAGSRTLPPARSDTGPIGKRPPIPPLFP
jgi:hypothetical protein